VNNTCCVRELRTKAEVDAAHYRSALHALEAGFDLRNVLSMSPLSQEVYWQLRGGGLTEVIK
jgi:hypothetical protein